MPLDHLTVGYVRKIIANLPDDAPFHPAWFAVPGDSDPCVRVHDFEVQEDKAGVYTGTQGAKYVAVLVSLVDLEDDDEFNDDDDEFDDGDDDDEFDDDEDDDEFEDDDDEEDDDEEDVK